MQLDNPSREERSSPSPEAPSPARASMVATIGAGIALSLSAVMHASSVQADVIPPGFKYTAEQEQKRAQIMTQQLNHVLRPSLPEEGYSDKGKLKRLIVSDQYFAVGNPDRISPEDLPLWKVIPYEGKVLNMPAPNQQPQSVVILPRSYLTDAAEKALQKSAERRWSVDPRLVYVSKDNPQELLVPSGQIEVALTAPEHLQAVRDGAEQLGLEFVESPTDVIAVFAMRPGKTLLPSACEQAVRFARMKNVRFASPRFVNWKP